jgi:folate-binding protein YgfZ
MQNWETWVAAKGGRLLEHGKAAFGAHAEDVAAVDAGKAVLAPLSDFALIRAHGEDALTFLQSQLSSDVREADATHSQYSSFSNAKGRMQANFLIWQYENDYYLMLPADIAPAIHKRLSMFVLRAKVKLELVGEQWALFGLGGADAGALAKQAGLAVPAVAHEVSANQQGSVVALPSGAYLLALKAEHAEPVTERLLTTARLIGSEAWALFDIRAGRPWVTQPTYEQFVAQMANLELIGAVSFKKGCFPGQEIVARTQYLGKLKKRLFHVVLPSHAKPGDELFSPSMRDQPIGMVVNVCAVGNDKAEALVVAQINAWESGVHFSSPDGSVVERLPLPYPLADDDQV